MKINPSLNNITQFLSTIDNPQDSFKSIQIAGTNGKGSVCTFIELMYLNYNYKGKLPKDSSIGKYISPHLVSVCERISIDGQEISESEFLELCKDLFGESYDFKNSQFINNNLESKPNPCNLTEFEKLTVIAFEYFKRKNIDIAILEVGLGGKWDATNIISPDHTLATAITNIAMDHMDYLGDTLEKIRKEKEGIIKKNVAHYEAEQIIPQEQHSNHPNGQNGVNFILAKRIFKDLNNYELNSEEEKLIIEEFQNRYQGRFNYETTSKILVDGAHNPAASLKLKEFIEALAKKESIRRKIFIIGILDKDYESILSNMFKGNPGNVLMDDDIVIFTKVNNNRSTEPMLLKTTLESLKADFNNIQISKNLNEALDIASKIQKDLDLIVIFGSLYLAGEYYSKKNYLLNKA